MNATFPEYLWYPDRLVGVKRSGEFISREFMAQPFEKREEFLLKIFDDWLGMKPSDEDIKYLLRPDIIMTEVDYYLGKVVSDHAGLGWSTHGHSAVDVNLYSFGVGSEELRGNHENIEIGDVIRSRLNLDLDSVTKKLNK